MANVFAPFAVPARGRRKQMAQKDACVVSVTLEQLLFCFVYLFVYLLVCSGIIVGGGDGEGKQCGTEEE